MPLVMGREVEWRSDFLYEHRFDNKDIPKSQGVRGERWVYARFDEQEPIYEQLFDLQTDPEELRNLATNPKFAAVLKQQQDRCDELLSK